MFRTWKLWGLLFLLVFLAVGFAAWRQSRPGVSATLEPPLTALGHGKKTVTLRLSAPSGPLASLRVEVVQGELRRPVLSEELPAAGGQEVERPLSLDAGALGLKEGPVELVVVAQDALWRPRPDRSPSLTHRFTVDLTPPTVELRAATRYVKHAGAGVAVYRVAGASRSGVRVGSAFFPGVAGLAADGALHVSLFAIPYDAPPAAPSVVAEDEAGNERVVGVPVVFLPTRFPTDTISLGEPFLRRKLPELAPQTPGTATFEQLVAGFLKVNADGRKAAEAQIQAVARQATVGGPLWGGPFRQQANTKVFANFPEQRTYVVDGKPVDRQWHLGIDLASSRNSAIAAANAGRVIFTGPNGIYGNMVVLDHGLGLTSLYAHLSEIAVTSGQTVQAGEILGRSGETGLAGGDHLHYAMLIHGVYTSPIEWWDARWIRDRLVQPMTDAGVRLPGESAAPGAPPQAGSSPDGTKPPAEAPRPGGAKTT